MPPIALTQWPGGLYDTRTHRPVTMPWVDLAEALSHHREFPRKEDAPGFGPYVLQSLDHPCARHHLTEPHRCDECVAQMTLAVFDVDAGTWDEVHRCADLIDRAGIASVWYTSYSYRTGTDRPPLRLVLPLERPIAPTQWPTFRAGLIRQYAIPCNPKQCSSLSHFYFLPSCPPDAHHWTECTDGRPVPVPELPVLAPRFARRPTIEYVAQDGPDGPVDTAALRTKLEARRTYLARSDATKAQILARVLKGEALADHGDRNRTTAKAAGMVAWVLSDQHPDTLMHILRPSVLAMQSAGSKLTEDKVRRMLESALANKAAADARDREIAEYLERRHVELHIGGGTK